MFKQFLLILLLLFLAGPTHCRKGHLINFRWQNLYPESFTWDPKSDHFVVGSLRHRQIISVSDAGVVSSLLSDPSLPADSFFVGISMDPRHHRVLAVVRRLSPPFSALTSYDRRTFRQLFLTPLNDLLPSDSVPVAANDVAVDYSGNAYVTDSANDVIFKVSEEGVATVLSRSKAFKANAVDNDVPYKNCGLNGVVYNSKGYLLVTQSNTGKLFKVDVDDGAARRVILNKELRAADGMAVRKDGVVVVVSKQKLYFIKSDDSWIEGAVFDETALEEERHASAVSVGAEDRVYVLYGHIDEGMMGNSEREEFSIVEVESEVEGKEENVWIFVLIGLGFVYFLVWRFQMRNLVHNMNKKTA
ncbi:NHL domain-containing protein [Perilla frutescens var. frutescens]|nr:NHL domain-containing protein [Perilla frutescens var. frutescens]